MEYTTFSFVTTKYWRVEAKTGMSKHTKLELETNKMPVVLDQVGLTRLLATYDSCRPAIKPNMARSHCSVSRIEGSFVCKYSLNETCLFSIRYMILNAANKLILLL